MSNDKLKINVLHNLVASHEEISQFVATVGQLLGYVRAGRTAEAWEIFKKFYKNNILDHFDFEEVVVFPVILAGYDHAQIRVGLEMVHREIVQKCLEVDGLFERLLEKSSSDMVKDFEGAVVALLAVCKAHAEYENRVVLPMIAKQPGSNAVLGRNALKYNVDYKNRKMAATVSSRKGSDAKTNGTENTSVVQKSTS